MKGASGPNGSTFPFAPKIERDHRRVLLFVAPPGSVSDAMAAAIEREFGWISVRYVPELDLACNSFECDVQLIVVESNLLDTSQHSYRRLAESHPGAVVAAMTATLLEHSERLQQLLASRLVRGILPIEANLDIFLSIIRILLNGGEYFPPKLFRRVQQADATSRTVNVAGQRQSDSIDGQWTQTIKELTDREIRILTLVSRGHQNKVIAFELGLSENTIKIHLHNLITKMGVHNRTEASAKFFEISGQREGGRH